MAQQQYPPNTSFDDETPGLDNLVNNFSFSWDLLENIDTTNFGPDAIRQIKNICQSEASRAFYESRDKAFQQRNETSRPSIMKLTLNILRSLTQLHFEECVEINELVERYFYGCALNYLDRLEEVMVATSNNDPWLNWLDGASYRDIVVWLASREKYLRKMSMWSVGIIVEPSYIPFSPTAPGTDAVFQGLLQPLQWPTPDPRRFFGMSRRQVCDLAARRVGQCFGRARNVYRAPGFGQSVFLSVCLKRMGEFMRDSVDKIHRGSFNMSPKAKESCIELCYAAEVWFFLLMDILVGEGVEGRLNIMTSPLEEIMSKAKLWGQVANYADIFEQQ